MSMIPKASGLGRLSFLFWHEVIQDLWALSTTMASVAATEELQNAELEVEVENHEQIAANAKQAGWIGFN